MKGKPEECGSNKPTIGDKSHFVYPAKNHLMRLVVIFVVDHVRNSVSRTKCLNQKHSQSAKSERMELDTLFDKTTLLQAPKNNTSHLVALKASMRADLALFARSTVCRLGSQTCVG